MVYNDPDPDIGFVLLPDMKWDQGILENLYMLAVVRKRGILSLRELNAAHLPLLRNVLHKGKVWGWSFTTSYRIVRNFRGFRGLEFYTKIKSTKIVC